ncbi:hypothetical protein VTP01DRAFT_1403 [Rhizomucor pusillus]|uniref:uncharacterized protein n=1 Tax=Rhizomucor pusillus TaxID=4840 RepID=UPI003743A09D
MNRILWLALLYTLSISLLANQHASAEIVSLAKRVPQAQAPQQSSSQAAAPAASSSSAAPAASSPAATNAPASSGQSVNTAPQSATAGGNNNASSNPLASLPTSASYGNTIYPGSVSFISPSVKAGQSVSPLYRIDPKENVTFIWEFQSVLVRPVNLTLAAVGPQSATYTITVLEGGATSALWQLSNVPAATPLMNGYYQVQLYDQRGISAVASPGWLSPQTSLTIAFYSLEGYSNISATGTQCPYCFYDAGKTLKPMGLAFGIACITSVLFIFGILHSDD